MLFSNQSVEWPIPQATSREHSRKQGQIDLETFRDQYDRMFYKGCRMDIQV